MPAIWHNYRTVPEWIKELPTKKDCTRLCTGCGKTWKEIGSGMVHMVENIGRILPCGLSHGFYCDGCVKEINNEP